MPVVDLKDIPSTQPVPTGSVQRIFGNAEAAPALVQGQILQRGAGGDMRVAVQPANNCDWFLQASMIYMGLTALWSRSDLAIDITPADRYGRTQCSRVAFRGHNTVGWQTVVLAGRFQLTAGTVYQAYLWCPYTEGNVNQYYQAARHLNLFGYTIGEGSLS